ncbi:MAG: DedA family protein [Deltaproteobacteria bacterium]|mgnify:CR=1 FL=1|nr:MAG: DedA family protein [Deltaproteobacteria bacterium]
MLYSIISWLVQTIGQLGYPGIAFLMFLESSFFPFPSEVVIPPAGYLAARGEMDLAMVILMGILGSLLGALFNYWLSLKFGRPFFERYGRYLWISKRSLDRAERFFDEHGHITTFVGRLLPGIRQYISLPAGVARMNLFLFCLFTGLGAGIWVVILALVGYWVGNNQEVISAYLHRIGIVIVAFSFLIVLLYLKVRVYGRRKGS